MAHTEETKRKIAESVRRGHALHPRQKESLEKLSTSLQLAHAEGRAGGFRKGNSLGAKRKPESVQKALAAGMAVVVGSHGFGRGKRGIPDHCCAKHWVFESPDGDRYECDNLYEWCRSHEDMFEDDGRDYRMPLWDRAANGIARGASSCDPRPQWRGWVLISCEPIS